MTTQIRTSQIEELMSEHQSVLKVLGEIGITLSLADPSNPGAWRACLEQACAFFQKEVALHFRKEEEGLFSAMEKYLGRAEGPIAVMLREHQDHNRLLNQLCGAVEAGALAQVRSIWNTFEPFLSMHIMKEDAVLFPLAGNLLGESDWIEVGQKMAALNAGS
jgi:hemerythrin-like domain-containing protein